MKNMERGGDTEQFENGNAVLFTKTIAYYFACYLFISLRTFGKFHLEGHDFSSTITETFSSFSSVPVTAQFIP